VTCHSLDIFVAPKHGHFQTCFSIELQNERQGIYIFELVNKSPFITIYFVFL